MGKDISKAKFIISFAKFLLICYYTSLLVGLPESCGGKIRSFPLPMSFHHDSLVAAVQRRRLIPST
jgi:hypothetical protein